MTRETRAVVTFNFAIGVSANERRHPGICLKRSGEQISGIHSAKESMISGETLTVAMSGYVYILASKKEGTLYTGVTADLSRRVFEHKQRLTKSFTSRYGVIRLVYYQEFQDIGQAIVFEKRIKRWRRAWKINLIEEMNPDWKELYGGLGW